MYVSPNEEKREKRGSGGSIMLSGHNTSSGEMESAEKENRNLGCLRINI